MAPLFSDEALGKMAASDSALTNKIAALLPGGRQIIVEGIGHDIHADKAEALIAPFMEMIKAVKEKRRNNDMGTLWAQCWFVRA